MMMPRTVKAVGTPFMAISIAMIEIEITGVKRNALAGKMVVDGRCSGAS
jgi:hypothetical protein